MSPAVLERRRRERAGPSVRVASDLFRVLGDPNRIRLVTQLLESGTTQTVSELAPCCPVDFSVVSRHLRQLREAGVVEATKQGKNVLYRVNGREVAALLRRFADDLETCCPPPKGAPKRRARRAARAG